MRSQPDAGRCILLRYIRKQKQHQQSPPIRPDIDAPIEIGIRALGRRETCVNVPTCIAGIVRMWKSDREPSKALSRYPSVQTNQLVESGVQLCSIHRLAKRLLGKI